MNADCREQFKRCITALRLGREAEFAHTYLKVMDCLEEWWSNNSDICTSNIKPLLEESMHCQIHHNNIRLADLLEYELLPLVNSSIKSD